MSQTVLTTIMTAACVAFAPCAMAQNPPTGPATMTKGKVKFFNDQRTGQTPPGGSVPAQGATINTTRSNSYRSTQPSGTGGPAAKSKHDAAMPAIQNTR